MTLVHSKSLTVADQIGTVTVGPWPQTSTIAATDNAQPSDWNSAHVFSQSLIGNTAGSALLTGTNLFFAGGNNVTLSASQGTDGAATLSIVGGTAAAASINLSAGTTSNNLTNAIFSNSNNVSFGLDGSTITASASVASSLSNIRVSAGTTSNLLSALTFADGNGVSFGINASTVTASVAAAAGNTISYFDNYNSVTNTMASQSWFNLLGSSSYIMPFVLPLALSASFARFVGSLEVGQANTQATAANASSSRTVAHSLYIGFYSQGTGASSLSLSRLASSSIVWQQSSAIQLNSNGSQYSQTYGMTYLAAGNTVTASFTTAISSTNFRFFSTVLGSNIAGDRFLDLPFASSLPASNLWLAVGGSSSSTTAGGAGVPLASMAVSIVMGSQKDVQYQVVGDTATASSNWARMGQGSFSSNAAGMPAALGLGAISTSAGQPGFFFQLIRQA